jgi:hypothetical protein
MALVYLTRGLVPNDNPIPKDFGFDGMRVVDLNFDRPGNMSNAAQAMQDAYKSVQRKRRI